ncbi:MAG: MarR family winged helix-turn-helix transcriptional regulator [Ilumatobacter sp.]|uniref:MarR family winged helix-turn-helix transcriptional regulator n=1 Tax=Ilumatobacter sp. TaxID=1967498 RepID=UPI0026305410|nr:MarR family winged helix-turn-helix transcriptional regulator [Ilumatobacter sp.]MDJ0771362.1 MarR family winged helix-turn-helix transcriptional regulator [Ilumatobacter sp.]
MSETTATPPLSTLYQLFVASRLAGTLTSAALLGSGVDGPEYAIVSVLFARGPASVGEVAARTGTPVPTASRHLRSMERAGLLRREADVSDGRKSIYRLTAEGERRFHAAKVPFSAMHDAVTDELGDDAEMVGWALARLDHAMRRFAGETTAPRPSRPTGGGHVLHHGGEPLSDDDADHVRAYIDWYRARAAAR